MSSDKDNKACQQLHIVMFPWLAFGHINPFVQLCNKLTFHGVKVSFLSAPGNIPHIKSSLSPDSATQIIPFKIPQVQGLPPGLDSTSELNPAMADLLKLALDLTQPEISTLLTQLKPHFVMFDFLIHWVPKIAAEIGIKSIGFCMFSAICASYVTAPSRSANSSFDDLMKPPPGLPVSYVSSMKEFQIRNLIYFFMRFNGAPSGFERVMEGYNCDIILLKTCNEMEAPFLDYYATQFENRPILLTGPLVPQPRSGVLDVKWEKWLSKFSEKSVIYCAFGSETFLKNEEIKELALGLELTGLPFILVLNFPPELDAYEEMNKTLPQGFTERVKDRAMVHTGWVQQQQIIAHKSIGCFVCHSGFSSLIEAVVSDCQLVLLPMNGDQFFNSKLFAEYMKAGVEVNRRNEDGYFGKDDINEAVRTLMVDVEKEPSKSVRENFKKLREFFLNEDAQDNFIVDLVKKLEVLV